ncbi:hypothetical protein [Micromonospora pisi]|nr:hypothetical protein [Micromonospora pisi]
MNSALDAIRAADPVDNYGGAVADPSKDALVIYWRGEMSPAAQAALVEHRKRVPISVIPARYTEAELLAEAQRLSANREIAVVGPAADGSGLVIQGHDGAPGAAVRQWVSTTSPGVAVRYSTAPADKMIPATRQNDSSPWSAGARTDDCTTGPVVRRGTSAIRIMFAAHCGGNGTQVFDNNGELIGTVEDANATADHSLIVPNILGRGWTWDGPVQSTQAKAVASAGAPVLGNWYCSSGSHSGIICTIQMTEGFAMRGGIGPLALGDKDVATLPAGGQGDSGAPIYDLTGAKVIMRGQLKQISTSRLVPCQGLGGRLCSSRIAFSSVPASMSALGVGIVTG